MGLLGRIFRRKSVSAGIPRRIRVVRGKRAEQKKLLRSCVQEIKLAPVGREVEACRIPEPVVNGLVAGAGFEPATFGL